MTATATAPLQTPPIAPKGSYEDAMNWLRSTSGFRFVLDDADVHAEGRMTRKTVGAEAIEMRVNGEELRASSGARGVTWERRSGGKWSAVAAPPYGNRVYQRLTLAIDPQKKEGTAQLAGTEGTTNRYRFTNANTGEVHEVWVAQSDDHVERIRIGETVDLRITP